MRGPEACAHLENTNAVLARVLATLSHPTSLELARESPPPLPPGTKCGGCPQATQKCIGSHLRASSDEEFSPLRVTRKAGRSVAFGGGDATPKSARPASRSSASRFFARMDSNDAEPRPESDEEGEARGEAAAPASSFAPQRNEEARPNYVALGGDLYKKGTGGGGLFSRRNWKKRYFQLVLDSENEDEVNVGPLLRYADPKRRDKCIGRELLDGCVVALDSKPGRPDQFRFNLVWRDPGTGDITSERQLYAVSERLRAAWVAQLHDAIEQHAAASASLPATQRVKRRSSIRDTMSSFAARNDDDDAASSAGDVSDDDDDDDAPNVRERPAQHTEIHSAIASLSTPRGGRVARQ